MRISLNGRTLIIILVLLVALLTAVMTVSAADLAGSETTIAKVDLDGAEGLNISPISGTDLRLVSPWAIDATKIEI